MEEHAAPTSFTGCHTSLHSAKENNIRNVRHKLAHLGTVAYNPGSKAYEGDFPKLMLTIKNRQLFNVSLQKNPEYYSQLILTDLLKQKTQLEEQGQCISHALDQHIWRLQHLLLDNDDRRLLYTDPKYSLLHTINNIKVADLNSICPCQGGKCYSKPLFEKILPSDELDEDAMAYGSCYHTVFAAAKRQIKSAPEPDPDMARDFVKFAISTIEKEVGPELDNFGYSYSQWYNRLPLSKQKKIQQVKDILEHKSNTLTLTDAEYEKFIRINPETHELDPHYEAICKVEIQNLDGKPRMVCSIPQVIKYVMGPVTWMLEDIFGHHLRGYCGGKNLQEMADMINDYAARGMTKVVEGDGSGFDNSQDVLLKEVDRYIYNRISRSIHHVDSTIPNILDVTQSYYKTMDVIALDPKSRKKKDLLSYSVLGTVFSGDCDTTLANTIRMALYNRYAMESQGLQFGHQYVCFSKGDDFTLMFDPAAVSQQTIEDNYWRCFLPKPKGDEKLFDNRKYGLGQICKFLEFGELDSIKFCSLQAYYKNKEHTQVYLSRNPEKYYGLSNYSRKTKTMGLAELANYLYDQATALIKMYPHIYIHELQAERYLQRAELIAHAFNHNNLPRRFKFNKHGFITLAQAIPSESAQHLPYEDANIYDIKLRDNLPDLDPSCDYWDAMKKHIETNNTVLSPEEIKIVNHEIELRHDIQRLENLLAPNKHLYKKLYE